MKILIATVKPFAPVAVEQIRSIFSEAGYEVEVLEKYVSQEDLIKAVATVDSMIIRSDKVDEQVLEAAAQLKIVVRAGAGYDNIDLEAASAKNVVVMNTPGQNSNAVAELALGLMVYMARNLFNGKPGTELKGKTLGIHAYGHVGREVARIARGFGMETLAYDPFVNKQDMLNEGTKPVDTVEDLYESSRYVSLHMPANDKTVRSINYDLLKRMPQGATLVNTARKEIIDEDSLIKILREREDFRYVSDIVPDCAGDIVSEFPGRFFFSPKKMGAQTAEANINAGVAAARQIVKFFKKGDTTFQVNK